MPVKVAQEWFAICGGCEVTVLDVGEPLLDLLPELEFVHMPVIMDHKLFGQTGENSSADIPEADVGIITGGIRNEENKHLAELMRSRVNFLIAMGSCAAYGGIPALANQFALDDLYERVYRGNSTTDPGETPKGEVPALLDRVEVGTAHVAGYSLDGKVRCTEMMVEALARLVTAIRNSADEAAALGEEISAANGDHPGVRCAQTNDSRRDPEG